MSVNISPSLEGVRRNAADASLLSRLEQGDESAMAVLYDAHSALVYSVALSILHDSEKAEDVLIDTFLQLWREPTDFVSRRRDLKAALAINAYNRAVAERARRVVTRAGSSEANKAPSEAETFLVTANLPMPTTDVCS